MRIGLGTAQFGMDYGISNAAGQVPAAEARKILALAESAGVRVIDTARAYGDAETRLGQWLAKDHPFSIVTKLAGPAEGAAASSVKRWVHDAFQSSLQRLRATHVHGLLVHGAGDLLGARGAETWRAMETLRDDGAVAKIGVSVYTGLEIDALLDRYPLQLVQLPLNVLDQRLVRSGHLERLKAAGVEVHARSAFLQGLLLMDVPASLDRHFDPARSALDAFHAAARAAGRSPLEAAVSYVMSVDQVDTAIFGVTTTTQLAGILAAATRTMPPGWFAPFALDDERILDPSQWPR
ncbi:MAG: aldo/keto reductase [Chloroflexota bacterium]